MTEMIALQINIPHWSRGPPREDDFTSSVISLVTNLSLWLFNLQSCAYPFSQSLHTRQAVYEGLLRDFPSASGEFLSGAVFSSLEGLSWEHPIYQKGYNNIKLHKGESPRLYYSLPRKLLVSYAKCSFSPAAPLCILGRLRGPGFLILQRMF